MGINRTPRTWLAERLVVTAAMLNEEIRDLAAGIQAPWEEYTPVWSTGAGDQQPQIANGSISGRFHRTGKTVAVRIFLQAASGTSQGTGAQKLSLPVATRPGAEQNLAIKVFTGALSYGGFGYTAIGGSDQLILHVTNGQNNAAVQPMSNTSPNSGTAGNVVVFGVYETA